MPLSSSRAVSFPSRPRRFAPSRSTRATRRLSRTRTASSLVNGSVRLMLPSLCSCSLHGSNLDGALRVGDGVQYILNDNINSTTPIQICQTFSLPSCASLFHDLHISSFLIIDCSPPSGVEYEQYKIVDLIEADATFTTFSLVQSNTKRSQSLPTIALDCCCQFIDILLIDLIGLSFMAAFALTSLVAPTPSSPSCAILVIIAFVSKSHFILNF